MLLCFSLEITESCRLRHLTIPWAALLICQNRPATGGHSRPYDNFNFNQNYPARSVKSQIACTKEIGVFLAKILGKTSFVVNVLAGQFDDFSGCESYAKPDCISVRTRLPLYKGDAGVHYLKVLVKI